MAAAVLLASASFLVGCGGTPTRNVQFYGLGGTPGREYTSTGFARGTFPPGTPAARGHISLPWTSPISKLKPGTFVRFTISTPKDDPNVVTCKITSDGRVVATARASEGAVATCSGRV